MTSCISLVIIFTWCTCVISVSWDSIYSNTIDPLRIKSNLKYYTSTAHVASFENDRIQAHWTRDKFIEYGIPTSNIETYYPLINYPVSRSLALLSPFYYNATLSEKSTPENSFVDTTISFFAYSPSGFVRAQLIYANFGSPDDFQLLKDNGIDVQGKIVLIRYGGGFRGLKVRAAELEGAAAVIMYTDPKEDGFLKGKVYPEGPYRPASGIQRGSIHYPNFYPDAPCLPKIPAIPISAEDAEPVYHFLRAIQGQGIKFPEWQGGITNISYYTGPFGMIELNIENKNEIKPIWNVIGRIPGTTDPDKYIIVGNHRDAWVYGAVDPSSGSSSMLEFVHGIGNIYKLGWRPKRTLIIASWDAEEYGIVGSTEWVEDHKQELENNGVIYINTDSGVSGTHFKASASPSLSAFIRNVTKYVHDPNTQRSVYEEWASETSETSKVPIVGPLGFGSDYVSFLQHVGIASMDIKFSGPYGVYHSSFDSFDWMEKFGDPTFEYHAALTEIIGLMVLRLTDSEILPFEFVSYAESLRIYTQELQILVDNSSIFNEHEKKQVLQDLFLAIKQYNKNALLIDKEISQKANYCGESMLVLQDHECNDNEYTTGLNDRIMYAERNFLDPEGIPNREWYKHVLFAPDEWAGYKAEMFPSLRDSIRKGNITELKIRINSIQELIMNAGELLKV